MRNGHGLLKWGKNTSYEGQFKSSKLHGQGVYTWDNGRVYTGEFSEGKK